MIHSLLWQTWASFMEPILGACNGFSFLSSLDNHISFKLGKCQQHGSHQFILRRVVEDSQIQDMDRNTSREEFIDYFSNLSDAATKAIHLGYDQLVARIDDRQKRSELNRTSSPLHPGRECLRISRIFRGLRKRCI